MLEKFTAMQDKLSIPEMFEKFAAMSHSYKIGCPRDACKAHSHAGHDVPGMLEKLTAMQDMYSRDV